ncbi:hypothetical protein [Caldisericum exile]|nr:hypothetical protein [Caldisericum exile]
MSFILFDTLTLTKVNNPAEQDILTNFYNSMSSYANVLYKNESTLKIWIVPEDNNYVPDGFQNANTKYGKIYMEFRSKIQPAFMPAVGVGKNGLPFVIRVVTEIRPYNPETNK